MERLAVQRYRHASGGLAFEAVIGDCEMRQRLVFMVVDRERALLKRPVPAGEEFARAAALRLDGAFMRAGRASEIHAAGWRIGGRQYPAAGHVFSPRRRRLKTLSLIH